MSEPAYIHLSMDIDQTNFTPEVAKDAMEALNDFYANARETIIASTERGKVVCLHQACNSRISFNKTQEKR